MAASPLTSNQAEVTRLRVEARHVVAAVLRAHVLGLSSSGNVDERVLPTRVRCRRQMVVGSWRAWCAARFPEFAQTRIGACRNGQGLASPPFQRPPASAWRRTQLGCATRRQPARRCPRPADPMQEVDQPFMPSAGRYLQQPCVLLRLCRLDPTDGGARARDTRGPQAPAAARVPSGRWVI